MQGEGTATQLERTLTPYVLKLLVISIVIIVGFCVYHVLVGEQNQAIVEAIMAIVYCIAIIALREPSNVTYVMHVVMATGLLGLLFNMHEETNAAMWIGTLIVASFALFEKKQGIYWVIIVNLSVLLFMWIDSLREAPAYDIYFSANVVLSCIWLSMISFFAYRNATEQHQWTLVEETERERKAMAQTLAGGMAHVMNNEMLAIVGRLECLQFRLNRKEDAKELEEIVELAMKVSEHGNRLALYAQPDHEQTQNIHLYDTCKAVVKQFEKSLPREIQLNLQQSEFSIRCFGDEVQIAQALAQIVENAKDAIAERWKQRGRVSDGHIGISFDKENIVDHIDGLKAGQYVRITVADDGCGVAEDMQDQVFKPFVTTKLAGRGLGLAVAQSIVHRHGGKIDFESDVDKGSLFHVWLPMSEKGVPIANEK